MKSILIVGAGRQGKGFLGEVFEAAGWEVNFLDCDIKVIDSLRAGPYKVKLYRKEGMTERIVEKYNVFPCDEEYSCLEAVLHADLIALSLYPEQIREAAGYLGRGLVERARGHYGKVTILSCTNINHLIPDIQEMFERQMEDEASLEWFRENAVIRDVIVRRSTDAESNSSRELVSLAVMSMLIQKPITVDIEDVEFMELKDQVEELKDIKLYTYNAPHATCAYAGHLKGYRMINESEDDPEIAKLMGEVLEEAIQGLSKEFRIPAEEIRDFCNMPQTKDKMDDSIYRVAKDPMRKLGRDDRLTGNAMFCYKYGIYPKALIRSIANGMAYDEAKDEKAVKIQQLIRSQGIEKAVSQVTGVPLEHDLVKQVSAVYREISNERTGNNSK